MLVKSIQNRGKSVEIFSVIHVILKDDVNISRKIMIDGVNV